MGALLSALWRLVRPRRRTSSGDGDAGPDDAPTLTVGRRSPGRWWLGPPVPTVSHRLQNRAPARDGAHNSTQTVYKEVAADVERLTAEIRQASQECLRFNDLGDRQMANSSLDRVRGLQAALQHARAQLAQVHSRQTLGILASTGKRMNERTRRLGTKPAVLRSAEVELRSMERHSDDAVDQADEVKDLVGDLSAFAPGQGSSDPIDEDTKAELERLAGLAATQPSPLQGASPAEARPPARARVQDLPAAAATAAVHTEYAALLEAPSVPTRRVASDLDAPAEDRSAAVADKVARLLRGEAVPLTG